MATAGVHDMRIVEKSCQNERGVKPIGRVDSGEAVVEELRSMANSAEFANGN